MISPVVLGEGKRLFGDGTPPRTLKMIDHRVSDRRQHHRHLPAGRPGRDRQLRHRRTERAGTGAPGGDGGRQLVTLQLFGHPFSSYTPEGADRAVGGRDAVRVSHGRSASIRRIWPSSSGAGRSASSRCWSTTARGRSRSTPIIEHLQAHHPGPNGWIPDGEAGRRVRFLDRFFDLYVMGNMQKAGLDILRPEESRDPFGVEQAREPSCAPPMTGWRRISATGRGRSARRSRWPTAPPRRRYSMPTGSRRSAPSGRGSPPIARGCSLIRSWLARSMKAGLIGIFPAGRARPRLGEGARGLQFLTGAEDLAELAFHGCGRRRCGRGGSGAPAPNSACARHAVGVLPQAEHAERVPFLARKARHLAARDAGTEARRDGVERIREVGPGRAGIGAGRARRRGSCRSQPAIGDCAASISSGVMPSKKL